MCCFLPAFSLFDFCFLLIFFFLTFKQIMGSTLFASGEACVRAENRKNMGVFSFCFLEKSKPAGEGDL